MGHYVNVNELKELYTAKSIQQKETSDVSLFLMNFSR